MPLFALASVVGSCAPRGNCDDGPCAGGTTLTVRLAIPRGALEAAGVTLCRKDLCATRGAAIASPLASRGATAFALEGALAGSGQLETIDGATSRLTLTVNDPGGLQADGDRYALTVTDRATSTTAFAFERAVSSYTRAPVAARCSARCSSASIRVYPESTTGLTCTAVACTSGVTLRGRASVAGHDLDGATFRACRNDACGGATLTGSVPAQSGDAAVFEVHGAVDATVTITLGVDEVFGVSVAVTGDPADMKDGDAYAVELLNPGGGLILGFTMPVTYTEAFPDGAACDTVPCRTAEGTLLPP